MNFQIIELKTFLSNGSFLALFCTTVFYWIKLLFFTKKNYQNFGLLGLTFTNLLITCQLLIRWFESGHFPLSNLYESLLFLSWCFLILYIFFESQFKINFFGIIISPIILCLVTFADFLVPSQLQMIRPLVPALQSNWLFMHVSVMILSYACLLFGSFFGLFYLLFFYSLNKNGSLQTFAQTSFDSSKFSNLIPSDVKSTILNGEEINLFKVNQNTFLNFLDFFSYRIIGIGFCFLTLGILSGAVWANETWGNYWSWDPKETWAFITWLTFAIYLHTRLVIGWEGVKPAFISVLGFCIIWICYLGVNLVGKGLHTYGFLNG